MFSLKHKFAQRYVEPEIMDDFNLDPVSHTKALDGLERINKMSRTANSFWPIIRRFFDENGRMPLKILDIACGGGDIIRGLSVKAGRAQLPITFEGCDFNPRTIEHAAIQSKNRKTPLNYFKLDVLHSPIPERFDGIISNLFLHHLSTPDILRFFKSVKTSKVSFLIISDLERSFGAWLLAWIGSRILSNSPVVHADGPQSVRAALTPTEILTLANQAGLTTAWVKRVWPMRYLLVYRRE